MAVVAAALALGLAVPALGAASSFDDPADNDTSQQFTPPAPSPAPPSNPQRRDTPNDPEYDEREPDGGTPGNFFSERYDLFGFPSALTASSATYKDAVHGHVPGDPQVSGYNAAGAWKLTRGRPDVSVAILDTGIRWGSCGIRDRIRLSRGELDGANRPQKADGSLDPGAPLGGRDLNGNGAFDVDDYADDARVGREFPGDCGGKVTAKDLINEFSDGSDADGNGYVDDIAGWNFFDDSNDPTDRSSYFAARNHGTGRAVEAVEKGNDGEGSIGVCPKCQFVPFRIWDTFVADANNFGLAVVYAADNGIDVVEGADGALYHSAFMEAASQYAYEHGVAQVYSGDDLNTGNHNYPANYDHTMLIQGVSTDVQGLGDDPGGAGQVFAGLCSPPATLCLGSNAPVQTYFRGANTTQFGGHSSVSMEGPTGSTNTGKAAGAVALVLSAAKDAGVDLSADESRIVVEQTAEDVTQANTTGAGTPDPAQPGWDEHFGYGRVDLGQAVALAGSGKAPPEASIESPDWYAPLTGATANLTGRLRARFATDHEFDYTVEWGVGLAPTTWQPVPGGEGTSTGTVSDLGTLDLNAVRAALATHNVAPDPGGPTFSPTSRNPFKDQFTVRVTVNGKGIATPGVDRKVLTALPDGQGLRPGFPKRLGTGGEAPMRYADLNGDNVQELIVPLEDGTIHAYEPDGSELPGWPVETQVQYSATGHGAASAFDQLDPPREPLRGPTIADLDDDGSPEVITAAGLRVYVFEADGSVRDGFPVRNDPDFCKPADQRQNNAEKGAWHRKCGFIATPAVGRIEGANKPLNIVAPSLDGHLYVLREDGTSAPGFPVDLVDPAKPDEEKRFAESINQPAIGDIGGGPGGEPDGKDDIVVPTNEAYGGGSNGNGDVSFAGILGGAAGQQTRVYAVDGATGDFLPGWPIAISGIIQDVLPLIGPGHDPSIATIGGETRIIASATSGSLSTYATDGSHVRTMDQGTSLNLFESAAVGDVLGAGNPAVVKYQVGIGQAANLLLVGQNVPYSHFIGAFDGSTGASLPGFPTITDDYQFLSASTIAKIDPARPTNQIVAGTGLGLLHAYDGATGQDVAGFPKVTGGWMFAPAALSDDGRIAGITREGFLFEWSTAAPACQSEWPSFRHDPQGSGNYDRDGTAPGALANFTLTTLGGDRYRVAFDSAGDDGLCGTPAEYAARIDGKKVDLDLGAPVAGGKPFTRDITLPGGTAGDAVLSIEARDEAGNGGFRSAARLGQARLPESRSGTADGEGDGRPGDGASAGPRGASPSDACTDALAPRSLIDARGARVSRRRVNIAGIAQDAGCGSDGRAGRVQVAVARRVRGGCRYLKRNRRLSARKSCRKPHYLTARSGYSSRMKGSRFRFKLTRLDLPAGRYTITVRATDPYRNVETRRSPGRIRSVVVR
jgi:hypothetical protein